MKRYYVSVQYQNKFGVDAESDKDAERWGRLTLAEALLSGVMNIDVSEPQNLLVCDGCFGFFTAIELRTVLEDNQVLCAECAEKGTIK